MNMRTSLLLLLLSSSYSFTMRKSILIDNKTSRNIVIDSTTAGEVLLGKNSCGSNSYTFPTTLWIKVDGDKKCDKYLDEKTKKITVRKLLGKWFITKN